MASILQMYLPRQQNLNAWQKRFAMGTKFGQSCNRSYKTNKTKSKNVSMQYLENITAFPRTNQELSHILHLCGGEQIQRMQCPTSPTPTPKEQNMQHSPALTAAFSRITRLYMKRIYLAGFWVLGPSRPSKCKIRVASTVCSQSSINSHK